MTRKDLPETIEKIAATFESYWNSSEFEYYDEGQRERLTRALKAELMKSIIWKEMLSYWQQGVVRTPRD